MTDGGGPAALIATDLFAARLFAKTPDDAHLGVLVPADLAELALFSAVQLGPRDGTGA